MNKQSQYKNFTEWDRYPLIFDTLTKLVLDTDDTYILSFGCSTGEEVKTLRTKYYPKSIIVGVDIDNNIIKNLKSSNRDSFIFYMTPSELKKSCFKFNIILCMSVLCIACGTWSTLFI